MIRASLSDLLGVTNPVQWRCPVCPSFKLRSTWQYPYSDDHLETLIELHEALVHGL